jgi:hypothetical protein
MDYQTVSGPLPSNDSKVQCEEKSHNLYKKWQIQCDVK